MRWNVAGIILACLAVYLANGRPHPEVDCVGAPYTAWSLVRKGSVDLREYPELRQYVGASIRELPDGSWVSMRPLGSALAVMPFVAPFAILQKKPLSETAMHQLGKLAAAVWLAVAAGFFFVVCQRLAPAAAWPATILLAFGTCLWSVASQALWMHGPATFWLCCALYYLTRADAGSPPCRSAAGFALGFAIWTRPTTAFFALATGVVLLAQRRWREAAWLSFGGWIPLAFLCLLNWLQFGNPVLGGYATDNWNESAPLWLSLGGLLIAPSRGLLVYSPAFLLVPLGTAMLFRRGNAPWSPFRGMLLAWLLAAGVTLLFYARWHDWRGGWCYGPRFLCETLPVLCLLVAVGYCGLQEVWQQRLVISLIAVSVAVHFVGIFGYSGYEAWQARHDLPDQGLCLFNIQDSQIEAHARALGRKLMGKGRGNH
jgi:hypothetical protein